MAFSSTAAAEVVALDAEELALLDAEEEGDALCGLLQPASAGIAAARAQPSASATTFDETVFFIVKPFSCSLVMSIVMTFRRSSLM